jgi:hypothetical protein
MGDAQDFFDATGYWDVGEYIEDKEEEAIRYEIQENEAEITCPKCNGITSINKSLEKIKPEFTHRFCYINYDANNPITIIYDNQNT